MLKQVVEVSSQDIRRLEVVTSDNMKKTPASLADMQIQSVYNSLDTTEDEQDPSEDSSWPSECLHKRKKACDCYRRLHLAVDGSTDLPN